MTFKNKKSWRNIIILVLFLISMKNVFGQEVSNNNFGRSKLLTLNIEKNFSTEEPVVLVKKIINNKPVNLIYVNMNKPELKITPILSSNFPKSDESFQNMIQRTKPTAAINGTFFCTSNLKPVGDIVIDGKLKNFGGFGTALAITSRNEVKFINVPHHRHCDWKGYETVLACGPRLIKQGEIQNNARAQGFKDSHVLGAGSRSAVGLTPWNYLIFLSTDQALTLKELSDILLKLGCIEAMNLDGGASTAMSYNGQVIVPAGRKLTNLLGIYQNYGNRPDMGTPVVVNDTNAVNATLEFSPDKLYKKSVKLYNQGKYPEAKNMIYKAIKHNPTAANYKQLALIEIKMGNTGSAADAYAQMARIYYEHGMYSFSAANASKALKFVPDHPEAKKYFKLSQHRR